MPVNEVDVAYQWIQATLSGDSTLQSDAPGGVWRAEAPDGTTPPYVAITYMPQQSKDVEVFGGRAYSELYFEVCAAGPAANLSGIASAAAQIETLITITQQTAITGGTIMSSVRNAPVESDPLIEGERWNATGGLYRVRIKST